MSRGTGAGYRSRAGGGYSTGNNYSSSADHQDQTAQGQDGDKQRYDSNSFYEQVFNHKRLLELFARSAGRSTGGYVLESSAGRDLPDWLIYDEATEEVHRDPREEREEQPKSLEEQRQDPFDFDSSVRSDAETESRRQLALIEALREARRQTEEEGGAMLLEDAVEQEEQARKEALDPPKRWFPVATAAVINEIAEMELARSAAAA